MRIYYQSSENKLIDLIAKPYMMLTDTGLFNYERKYTQLGNAFPYIADWANDMVTRPFKIVISGDTENEYLQNLARITEMFDRDIGLRKPGRLYMGDWYLEGYIFSSTKPSKYLKTLKTTVEFQIVSEDGNWKSSRVEYYRTTDAEVIDGFGYPHNYPYNYGIVDNSLSLDNSDSYLPSDFKLTIYGRCANPSITIADNVYQLNDVLINTSEKLVVDSTNHTITLYKADGSTENYFDYRDRDYDIFQLIPTGVNSVSWNMDFNFDLEVIPNRAEPKLYSGEIEPLYVDGDNLYY